MAGTWSTLANSPPDKVATTFLLTDGTVLAQGYSTNHWYRLTPDSSGDYQNGTWTTMADSVHGPLYYVSGSCGTVARSSPVASTTSAPRSG